MQDTFALGISEGERPLASDMASYMMKDLESTPLTQCVILSSYTCVAQTAIFLNKKTPVMSSKKPQHIPPEVRLGRNTKPRRTLGSRACIQALVETLGEAPATNAVSTA